MYLFIASPTRLLERCENYQAITPAQVVNCTSRPGRTLGDGVGVYSQYLLTLGDRGKWLLPCIICPGLQSSLVGDWNN